ncbi:hypothetical protein Plhal304r1_c020g0073041 [Plasmopara halstedii]
MPQYSCRKEIFNLIVSLVLLCRMTLHFLNTCAGMFASALNAPPSAAINYNLEHFVAALAYSNFLPQLRGLDRDEGQALNCLEKSYLMQLDMVRFLLQNSRSEQIFYL